MAIKPGVHEQVLIPAIRASVIQRIEQTSLRTVAREIGMTPSGLMKFVDGASPYRKTHRKLEAWHLRRRARASREEGLPSAETAAAAIRILAMFFPPLDRGKFVDATLQEISRVIPREASWREEFERYDEYMRAGEVGPDTDPDGAATGVHASGV